MHIFKIDQRLVTNVGTFENKKKKKSFISETKWGTLYQNEATKLQKQEKKKLRQFEKKAQDDVANISDSLGAVKLTTSPLKVFQSYEILIYLFVIIANKSIFK